MANTTIGKMTIEELRKLIADVVEETLDRQLTRTLGVFEIQEEAVPSDEAPETRSVEEILDSIDRNRWTPPPGAKSSLEFLREDRDR